MKTYLHGPMDYAKTLKLQFRVLDLYLQEERGMPVVGKRRKKTRRWALVAKAEDNITHSSVGECETYEEQRYV